MAQRPAWIRFQGQIGAIQSNMLLANKLVPAAQPVMTMTLDTSNTLTAKFTWSENYTPFFAQLFGVKYWPMTGTSQSSVQIATPYLEVQVLLDVSGSMEIGATASDINNLQVLTACSASATTSGQGYSSYGCTGGTLTYNSPALTDSDGNTVPLPACPIPGQTLGGVAYPAYPTSGAPTCTPGTPLAGQTAWAPCAFACHWNSGSAYSAASPSDYFWLARSTLGTSSAVTLRFDLVKTAVNEMIGDMQSANLTELNGGQGNLTVGVFTFADILTQVYPSSGVNEAGDPAGSGWSTAISAVGVPPSASSPYPGTEQGIQPYVGANGGETDFPTIMTALQGQLNPAGKGLVASAPRKVLFIVTDGLQDPSSRVMGAFDPNACTYFKNTLGYTVYVLYTPYYPLMNTWTLQTAGAGNVIQAEPTAPTSIPYNLQQCASSPTDYIEASDSAGITAALKSFLTQALSYRAKLTK